MFSNSSVVFISLYLISSLYAAPVDQPSRALRKTPTRITRNAIDEEILSILRPDPVTLLEHDEAGQCIFVKSEEGTYSYTSPGGTAEVCGLYVISEPNQFIEFEFEDFDVSCSEGGLLSVIDGWELNGQFFPGTKDHQIPRNQRYYEFCGKTKPATFRMSQNVGLLEFRIPSKDEGFKVRVRFRENPKPCNVVLQKPQGVYTLRNYGREVNCTVSIIFPESFRVLASSVGERDRVGGSSLTSSRNLCAETGIIRKCKSRGLTDYVEIRGGDGLDPDLMTVAEDFCGVESIPGKHKVDVFCGNTAVRLVSSGHHDNSVTLAFDLLLDLKSPALICPALIDAL